MTEEYITKLIELAKEVESLTHDFDTSISITRDELMKKQMIFQSKLNYLLGYILSLEELKKEEGGK